jgi:hypothetical protein
MAYCTFKTNFEFKGVFVSSGFSPNNLNVVGYLGRYSYPQSVPGVFITGEFRHPVYQKYTVKKACWKLPKFHPINVGITADDSVRGQENLSCQMLQYSASHMEGVVVAFFNSVQ